MSREPSSEAHLVTFHGGGRYTPPTPPSAPPARPRAVRVEGVGTVSADGTYTLEPSPPKPAQPARRQPTRSPVVRRGRVAQGRVVPGALTETERAELAAWRNYGADIVKKVTQW